MFFNCVSLTTLNLSSFDTSKVSNTTNMFEGCNENILYCINNKESNQQSKLLSELIDHSFQNNNC